MYIPALHNNLFLFSIMLLHKTCFFKISMNFHLKTICCNPHAKKSKLLQNSFICLTTQKKQSVLLAFSDSYLYPDSITAFQWLFISMPVCHENTAYDLLRKMRVLRWRRIHISFCTYRFSLGQVASFLYFSSCTQCSWWPCHLVDAE